jgi:GTP-binding protein
MADYMRKTFPNLDYVPLAFITAKANRNVHALLNLAQNLQKQAAQRVSTADLNRVLREALEASPPPLRQNRRPKVFYGTQVSASPPTIVLFTNRPELLDNTYQRYLIKTFRDNLPFADVPIKLYLRQKRREDASGNEAVAPQTAPRGKKRPARTPAGDQAARQSEDSASELWTDL